MKKDKFDKLLEKWGPEKVHELGEMLMDVAIGDINQTMNSWLRHPIPEPYDRPCTCQPDCACKSEEVEEPKKEVPLNIPELISQYDEQLKTLNDSIDGLSMNVKIITVSNDNDRLLQLYAAKNILEAIKDDLSSWMVYNY
tara:strand:+ start:217038 stop:217457 length:420 start_codon:yes stop_codon:yes gene_type:complete